MGTIVLDRIQGRATPNRLRAVRRTVPGFKDLAAASRRAIEEGASLVVACAMPGPEPIDETCAGDCKGHADNAFWMVTDPDHMITRAGTGRRQGAPDAGTIAVG
jgi:riboflavin synthase